MKIWKNTSTLDGFDQGLNFVEDKRTCEIALLGSKRIKLSEFKNLRAIFRAGIGKDNVPEEEAKKNGIIVSYPDAKTIDLIFKETASFTCNLIFKMLYNDIGTINPWRKKTRLEISAKTLLVIGCGNIGIRVKNNMQPFLNVISYDSLYNKPEELVDMIKISDVISLHIPNTPENKKFFDKKKIGSMKDDAILINTARGSLVDENALFEELNAGRVKSAFDVFWKEPYNGKLSSISSKYFHMTPHVASTCRGFLAGCRASLDNLINSLKRND